MNIAKTLVNLSISSKATLVFILSLNLKYQLNSEFYFFDFICFSNLFIFRQQHVFEKNPIISDQYVANDQTIIDLNNNNFGLRISIIDDEATRYPYIDPSLLSFDIKLYHYLNGIEYINKFTLVNCCNPNFETNCLGCLCIKDYPNIKLNVSSKSLWSDNFSSFEINLNLCSNDTNIENSVICQSPTTIFEYITGKYLQIKIFDYFFDLEDYENPAKINDKTVKEIKLVEKLKKYFSISLLNVDILQNNNNFFSGEPKDESNLQY